MESTKPLMMLKRAEGVGGGANGGNCCNDNTGGCNTKLPESPRLPMEFLSRSWSLPALQLSRALSSSSSSSSSHPAPSHVKNGSGLISPSIIEEETTAATHFAAEEDHHHSRSHCHDLVFQDQNSSYTNSSSSSSGSNNSIKQNIINQYLAGNSFSFACNATSQLILERIMSQSDVSPLTSGRPSCSEPLSLSGGGQSCNSISGDQLPLESPTFSPPHHHNNEFDYKFLGTHCTPQLQAPINRVVPKNGSTTPVGGGGGGKTVGRWLKDRKEKKKEETRAYNAQLHAAVSVAAVAAAVAAAAAATASASSSSGNGKDEQAALTDSAMASAATLVAARCVEAAESMGADHDHLASVIGSAVNVQSHGDIMTLTAAAATALRGAATLKARAMKEVCNIAAVLPVAVEKSLVGAKEENNNNNGYAYGCNKPVAASDDVVDMFSEEFLARGAELLKRTRTGEFHWKIVSVYINKAGQVILKMKSKLAAGTFTKKKKKVLMDVCKNMPAWPERCRVDYGEERCYFGFKTVTHRIIQFECKNKKEHDAWAHGVSRLLSLAADQNRLNLRNYSFFGSR